MRTLVIDVECYRNYFLVAAMDVANRKVYTFELWESNRLSDKAALKRMLLTQLTVGFNSLAYDLPMILEACSGDIALTHQLWEKSNELISGSFFTYRSDKPSAFNHIDLINVAPGQSSLKTYGGRLHVDTLQDLPYKPDEYLSYEQKETLKAYCINDLDITRALYLSLKKAIDLRTIMGTQYGMDLRSKGDAQIAETVIKSELHAKTGKVYRRPDNIPDSFRYRDPKIIRFKDDKLRALLTYVIEEKFTLDTNGSMKLPEKLKTEKVIIADKGYSFGVGGLHSLEKKQTLRRTDEHAIIDFDVTSYYPTIILQQEVYPKHIGKVFLSVYKAILDRRIAAKRTANTTAAETLKIVCNSSFGKMGSMYSVLYSPELLIQVTLTGQLALLMLIERMSHAGIEVMSANTDGIVLRCPRSRLDVLDNVTWEWQMDTTYPLERTEYTLLASRDVNNYFAIKTNNTIKGKGVFAEGSLMKNPDQQIIPDAVKQYALDGTPVADTVRNCDDIKKFLSVRTVRGGALWHGEYLGKTVRFYASRSLERSAPIVYQTNGNRVPKSDGSIPVMTLPERLPDDINYDLYINSAEKLKLGVGL